MAEEQSKGIQQIEGCEVIYDMGSGLVIAKVPLDKVKEQDINARIMKNEMQDQLTANIKKRGQLESLAKLFGSNAVPGDSASVIQQAIKKAEKEGTITSKNRWQLIEYLCADYLSGR